MTNVAKIREDAAPAPVVGIALLREPFPENQVSKLPKETKAQREEREKDRAKGVKCDTCGGWHHRNAVHLDYVGHAALTDRLLDADPTWTWEPVAFGPDGLPAFDKGGGLWIRLTVCGMSRLGYGHAAAKPNQDPGAREKEVIGDALRNAAMRFGAALDLWHKGDLHAEEPTPSAEQQAINHLRACAISRSTFKDAWEANKDGWKGVMDAAAYARVVAEMKALAAKLPEEPKAAASNTPEAPADDCPF